MRWLLLCLSMLSFAACGERPCNSSTCSGCCSAGACVAGDARTACGVRGVECAVCRSVEQCVAAKCEPLPPMPDSGVPDSGAPNTCACASACCTPDGKCAGNNSIDACGPARTFCGTCDADQRCEAGACVAAACAGCLSPLGACFDGREDRTCGRNGEVCRTCETGQRCVNGACEYTSCGVTNCRFGCCMPDNRCELSPGAAACGVNGDACRTCTGTQQCIAGSCQ